MTTYQVFKRRRNRTMLAIFGVLVIEVLLQACLPLGLESLLRRTGGSSLEIVRCPNCGVDVRRNFSGTTD